MIVTALMIAALTLQDPTEMQTIDEAPLDPAGALPFDDQIAYQVDPTPPEPDPEFTVRPGTRYTSTPTGGGNVRFTLTHTSRVTIRFVGFAQSGILGPGTSFEGRDRNGNGIPDRLEMREIDIGPL